MNELLVSVIIPTQNRDKFLFQAIDSVLNQSYRNIEIIVVDDHSLVPVYIPDELLSSNVKLIRNERAKGGAGSRNIGIKFSTGDYICFLDDDDLYHPDKIKILIECLNKTRADVVFGEIDKFYDEKPKSKCSHFNNYSIRDISATHCISRLHTNSSLISRHCFNSVMFLDGLEKYQDVQLHLQLLNEFKVVKVKKTVAYWRQHSDGARITDMKSIADCEKTLRAYNTMKIFLEKRYPNNCRLKTHLDKTF